MRMQRSKNRPSRPFRKTDLSRKSCDRSLRPCSRRSPRLPQPTILRNSKPVLVITFLAALSAAIAQPATPAPDWLIYVPAEARLYVEVRKLSVLREQFQRHGIWNMVEELAGR